MLYNLIKSQFPEYVRENYPAFVDFVKAYYKWMEIQFSEKLESIVDVDATTDTIRLVKTFNNQNVSVANFIQEIVVGRTSGAKAIVKRGLVGVQHITLFVKYITTDATFINGEVIYVEQDEQSSLSDYQATLAAQSATGKVSSDFVEYFKSYLDVNGLFKENESYSSLFLKNIKQIYTSKGSEQALVFMLEAIHNATVGIIYPGESVLKASDGDWYQESFITVNTLYGALPQDTSSLYIKIGTKFRLVKTIRVQVLNSTTTRIFFRTVDSVRVVENDVVQFRNINGFVVFQARVTLSPVRIEVASGGRNWRVGQLLTIPGSVENTIARVTQVDIVGAIKNIDIIQAGYDHPNNQHAIVSPYDISLSGPNSTIVTELISTNPDVYRHNLIIRDSTNGVSETIRFSAAGYFDESGPIGDHYVQYSFDNPYNLEVLFTQQFNPPLVGNQDSQDDLLASRATVIVKTGPITRIAGTWTNDKGQVSNPQIVLEDNFYFQQFSYVIDSTIAPSKYIDVATAIHPAGMQLFTNATLETTLEVTPSASSFILYKELSFLEVLDPQDILESTNLAFRTFEHTATITENISNQFTPELISDAVTATDTGGVAIDMSISVVGDSVFTTDTPERAVTKVIDGLDTVSVTQQLSSTNNATRDISETVLAMDSITVTKTP